MTEQQHRDRLKLNGWPQYMIDQYINGWMQGLAGKRNQPSGSGHALALGHEQGTKEAAKL